MGKGSARLDLDPADKEIDMSKRLALFAAGALALSLNAFAADQNDSQSPNQPQNPSGTPVEQTKQDQDYMAAIKKCDAQSGADKEKCIDKAREKFNRM
jgi:hypothetical protein